MMYELVQRLKRRVPEPVLAGLRGLGVQRLVQRFYPDAEVELSYQRQFASELARTPEWETRLLTYWQRYRMLDRLLEEVQFSPEQRVLDVGCGLTSVLRCLPEPPTAERTPSRVGVDPLADQYRTLLPWPEHIALVNASALKLPFADGSFELVCCSNALDHMPDPAAALREMRRVLVPEGRLLLTVELFEPVPVSARADSGDASRANPNANPSMTGAVKPLGRGPAHPHSLTRTQADELLSRGFELSFAAVVPWLGLRQYIVARQWDDAHQELLWVGTARPGGRH